MIIYTLTVCMFFVDMRNNTCMDFSRVHQTIERCEQHGKYVTDKVSQSPLLTGAAFKCTKKDTQVKT